MGVTETLMGDNRITVPLRPGTARSFLRDIHPDNNLWATILVTSQDIDPQDIALADLLALARAAFVYLEQDADGAMVGDGLEWWLGNSGDGGRLSVGIDAVHTGKDFEAHFDDDVIAVANDLTKGSVIDGSGTTFSIKEEGGDTPREILDTLCAVAPGGPNFWRINPDGSIDADNRSALWPSAIEPTVLFTGRTGQGTSPKNPVVGLQATVKLDGLNGREVRTATYADWQDGVDNGNAALSIPARWTTMTGDTPFVRHYMDWRPKRPKPPTERWRKVATWRIAAQARANSIAAHELNERTSVRREISVEVHERDPHRYDITPGNDVWLYDLDQQLYDTSVEVDFLGETIHPTVGRVDSMDWPIDEGRGVYLLRWIGGNPDLVWITPHVDFEEGPVTLQIGSRDRFPVRYTRTRTLSRRDKRRIRKRSHKEAKLYKFYNSGFFR